MSPPVLYSLRHSPYAMRARMAILLSGRSVLLRDISMQQKPDHMLQLSPKATVPVLVLTDKRGEEIVIDESLKIMQWALLDSDNNETALHDEYQPNDQSMMAFIDHYDTQFVDVMKSYKAAARYRDDEMVHLRELCEPFLIDLESRMKQHRFLIGEQASMADYAIFPFIRQFARVDKHWFVNSPFVQLRAWLAWHYQSPIFITAMKPCEKWAIGQDDIVFNQSFK